MNSPVRMPLAAIALSIGVSTLSAQTTVTVPCNLDNTLYEDLSGFLSNGVGSNLFCGLNGNGEIRRPLMRFDVAGTLPAGALVLAARLQLDVVQSNAFLPANCDAHRVSQAWGEGASNSNGAGNGGGGAIAQPGDATWIHAILPGVLWANAGGDFDPTPSFSFPLPGLGMLQTAPLPGIAADVQAWLDNPATNFGWLFKQDELLSTTARRITSREGPGTPPSLEVTYLLPGQNGTWGTGCPVGTQNFVTSFVGAPTGGTTITIQHSSAPALSIGANFFALDLNAAGAPLQPGCTLYLPLGGEIVPGGAFLTDAAGSGSTPFNVPAGYPGYLINCQAAVLDANALLGFSIGSAGLIVLQ